MEKKKHVKCKMGSPPVAELVLGVQQTYRAMQRTCSCGNGRGYKTTQALQKHQRENVTQSFALDAAFVRSTCFQCVRLRISRFAGPFDSSMNTSTRAHSEIRTIYADTVEHARLLKRISSVQRYSLQRSMRENMRSAPCAASGIMAQQLL